MPVSNFLTKIQNFLHSIFLFLLGILSLIALLINLILFIPTFIWRPIAILFAKCTRPSLAQILSPMESVFSQVDSPDATKTVIIIQITLEGGVSYQNWLKTFEERVIKSKLPNGDLRYPQLQQSIVNWIGYKWWQWEENFDLRDHIKVKVADSKLSTPQGIHAFSKSLLNHKFTDDKSPWDWLWLLPSPEKVAKFTSLKTAGSKVNPESEETLTTIGFFRFHHSLADGYSMLALFHRLVDVPSTLPKTATKTTIAPKFGSKTPRYFLTIPFKTIMLFGELAHNTASSFLWKIPESKKSMENNFRIGDGISIQDILKVKRTHRVNFSSVIFSIITAGMRQFIIEKRLPLPPRLPTMLALPMKNHLDILQNKFSFGIFWYPVGEEDAVKRLKKVDSEYDSLRESVLPPLGYVVGNLHGSHFNFMGRILNSFAYSSLITTYFPIQGNHKINSQNILNIQFYLKFHQGQAGGVFCISCYKDIIHITPVFNASLMSQEDVDLLTSLMSSQFQLLLKTA